MRDDKNKEIEERSIKEIKGRIFWDSLQRPETLVPLAITAVSGGYLLILADAIGGGLIAIPIAIGAGILGTISLGWHWLIRGKHYVDKKGRELYELQARMLRDQEDKDFRNLVNKIRVDFVQMGFNKGSRELNQLNHEYNELVALLSRIDSKILINADRIDKLCREAYHQGLVALSTIGESLRLARDSNLKGLESEADALERTIRDVEDDPEKEWLLKISKERLELTNERLSKIKMQDQNIAKLLQISDQCEGRLHLSAIDVAALRIESSEEKANEVVSRLQDVVDMAVEVQEQIKRLESFNAANIT